MLHGPINHSLILTQFITSVLAHPNYFTSSTVSQLYEQTATPAAKFARRDGIPTLTFGPASNYVIVPVHITSPLNLPLADTLQSKAPTIAGSGISLIQRSEPTGGVDVFLGPDKQKKIKSIIDASCPDKPNSQCIQDMAQAFDYKEVGIQARQAIVVVVSALVVALAYWIQHTLDDNPAKADHVFIPESDMSQAASAVDSSTLVFVTTANDPSPITVMSATDTTDPNTSGLVVSTATANGDGYGKGDVVIQVPEDLGGRLHNIIGIGAGCAHQSANQPSLDCVEQVSEFVMSQSQQNAPLRDLVLLTTTLPDLKGDLATHVANVIQYATKKLTNLALSDAGLKFLAEVAFWVVYEQLIENIQVPDQIVIPAASTVSAAPPATSSSSCPPEDRKPNCSSCGGTQTNEQKKTSLCPGPKWKGCSCVDGPTYPFDLMDSVAFGKAQAVLKAIPSFQRNPPDNSITCASADKADVLSFNVQNHIATFCQEHDGQEIGDGTVQDWYDNLNGNWISIWASQDRTTCGNPKQKLNKVICQNALLVASHKCASGTTTKGGTTGPYQCMNFGFYGSDAQSAGKPVTCPDPNPLLNFGLNPCDTKCNNAGWENCEPDLEGNNIMERKTSKISYDAFITWGCFCKNNLANNSPCAGKKCGDPIKMRDGPLKNGQPRYGPYRDSNGRVIVNPGKTPPSLYACDVMCANGNYDCSGGKKVLFHNACTCTDAQSKGQTCVDAIRDYGTAGR